MIKRIELVDFMSHSKTVIEPAPGLTVLIGPNNVGKSAVVAALQILCYNENSTYVMRHGQKECSVTVETDDGHTITWQRKTSPSYIIDGQRFDRLGLGRVPDELHEVLRLDRVEGSGGDDFDIHFGAQKAPIFLLDRSGAAAARFFASSSDAIRLVQMQQRHNDKVRDYNARRRELEKTSKRLNAELAALTPVSDLERDCQELEESFRAIQQVEQQLETIRLLEAKLADHQSTVDRLQTEVTALEPLDPPPDLSPTAPLEELITALTQTSLEMARASQEHDALQSLAAPPTPHDTEALADNLAQRQVLEFEREWAAAESVSLRQLEVPPQLSATRPLTQFIADLREEQQHVARHQQQHALLQQVVPLTQEPTAPLQELLEQYESARAQRAAAMQMGELASGTTPPPDLTSTEPARALLREWAQARQQSLDTRQELDAITAEWEDVEAQLRATVEGETCPTCGGPIDVETMMHRSLLAEGSE